MQGTALALVVRANNRECVVVVLHDSDGLGQGTSKLALGALHTDSAACLVHGDGDTGRNGDRHASNT